MVLVGLGGILAEVLDDVAVLLAPAPDGRRSPAPRVPARRGDPARRRGRPAVDLDAVVRLVVGLASLLERDPSILEVDLNPVVAAPAGAIAVDAAGGASRPRG